MGIGVVQSPVVEGLFGEGAKEGGALVLFGDGEGTGGGWIVWVCADWDGDLRMAWWNGMGWAGLLMRAGGPGRVGLQLQEPMGEGEGIRGGSPEPGWEGEILSSRIKHIHEFLFPWSFPWSFFLGSFYCLIVSLFPTWSLLSVFWVWVQDSGLGLGHQSPRSFLFDDFLLSRRPIRFSYCPLWLRAPATFS